MHVGQQQDCAIAVFKRTRLDYASVVDHRLQELARTLRSHQHISTIGAQQSAIFNKGLNRALVHCYIQQTVTCNVEGDRCSGRQRHGAHICLNQTLVADAGAEHCNISPIGFYRALIDHHAAAACKAVTTRGKISIRHIQG